MRRPSPRIVNKTGLRGDDLRYLTNAALRSVDAEFPSWRFGCNEVYFLPSADYFSHGMAYCGGTDGRKMEIHVAQGFGSRTWEVEELAQLLEHEFLHLVGFEHEEMADEGHWWLQPVPWHKAYQVRYRKGKEPHALEIRIRSLTDRLVSIKQPE